MLGNILKFDCRWLSEIDDKFISDFISVFREIFDETFNYHKFSLKYINNIYGESVLVIAYHDNKPVAIDALWRNDINGCKAYQSVDTGVLPEYRGNGIFYGIINEKIRKVTEPCILYGFPNVNSYEGFIKRGWKLQNEYFQRVLLIPSRIDSLNHYKFIDQDYLEWWIIKDRQQYAYVKYFGRYFIVAKRSRFPIYTIVGKVDVSISNHLKKIKDIYILCYKSKNKTLLGSIFKSTRVITLYNNGSVIPLWKLDAI